MLIAIFFLIPPNIDIGYSVATSLDSQHYPNYLRVVLIVVFSWQCGDGIYLVINAWTLRESLVHSLSLFLLNISY